LIDHCVFGVIALLAAQPAVTKPDFIARFELADGTACFDDLSGSVATQHRGQRIIMQQAVTPDFGIDRIDACGFKPDFDLGCRGNLGLVNIVQFQDVGIADCCHHYCFHVFCLFCKKKSKILDAYLQLNDQSKLWTPKPQIPEYKACFVP
jgi:hypothetical protein